MCDFINQRISLIAFFFLFLGTNFLFSQVKIEGIDYQTGKPVSVEIKDGKIGRIQSIDKLSDEKHRVYIAPGLIDNQVNGFAGVSFNYTNGELDKKGIRKITSELWKKGVTTYFPTLTANSKEVMTTILKELASEQNDAFLHGSVPGYHLEGPYLSPEDGYRGAHPLKFVRKPDWNEFMDLFEASGRKILTVTVAPELEGAIDFIHRCTELGIVVALGHHNAPKAVVDEAALAGAKTCTHLGNGCANMINRHENPLWSQLANNQLMISIICDGFHLRDEEIATFYKVKGPEKTIITSDVTKFATLPHGQYINEDGETVELTVDGILRYPAQNVLFGSVLPVSRGVVHIMEVTGCTLADAIRMASTNPAELYRLNDRGKLEPGRRADIILFTVGERELQIEKTFVAGQLVYDVSK
jgi:N-acetylglucosamine-6-phosphate deacetylase